MTDENVQVRLAARPVGRPTADNFTVTTTPLPTPGDGQVLLRTRYLSLDPYMRGRMSDAPSYAPPVEVGGVMVGGTIGEVVASRSPDLRPGDIVLAYSGWQKYGVAPAAHVRKLDPDSGVPVTTALGILGMPGFTAYAGLTQIGRPKAGGNPRRRGRQRAGRRDGRTARQDLRHAGGGTRGRTAEGRLRAVPRLRRGP
jgi:NADPH-dependent curcumin reductase CurA